MNLAPASILQRLLRALVDLALGWAFIAAVALVVGVGYARAIVRVEVADLRRRLANHK